MIIKCLFSWNKIVFITFALSFNFTPNFKSSWIVEKSLTRLFPLGWNLLAPVTVKSNMKFEWQSVVNFSPALHSPVGLENNKLETDCNNLHNADSLVILFFSYRSDQQ